jgi:hypothetical protein
MTTQPNPTTSGQRLQRKFGAFGILDPAERRRQTAFGTLALICLATAAGCSGEDTLVSGGNAASDAGVDSGGGQLDAANIKDAGDLPDGNAAADTADTADTADAADVSDATDAAIPTDTASDAVAVGCTADQCAIDGVCYDDNATLPADGATAANACLRCVVATDAKAWTPSQGVCDDGNACTSGDACDDKGACIGVAKVCDDGNVCSADSCKDGACVTTAADGACDDGDACTANDACNDGACVGGGATACDDSDVCTIDACDPKTGCLHDNQSDKCKDDNVCTVDSCDKTKGCVYGANTLPCEDGSVCTKGDTCALGLCKGATVDVDDANPCTDDACDNSAGVSHSANSLPCDDDNACTVGDVCKAKACIAGGAKPDCDDGNGCTTDACDKAKGCTHANTSALCNDGTACTQTDTCKDGACKGVDVDCDDGNKCTVDACDKTLGSSNACRPQIDVTYPPRGATIKSEFPFVIVKGKVTSGGGAINSFIINNKTIKVGKDGSFSHEVTAAIGGNTLEMFAVDALGTKRKRVQAYLWSDSYLKPDAAKPKSGMVDPGVGYFLSKQAIDDGDHSLPPNDLATIFELFLQSYDFAAVLPNPAYQGSGITAVVTDMKYDKAKVTLAPIKDALRLNASVPNITAKIKVKWSFLNLNGNLTITAIKLTADVQPKVVNHALVTDVNNVKAELVGFDIKLTGLGALLNPLIAGIKGQFATDLETTIGKALKDQLGPVISSALSALAFGFDIGVAKLDGSGGKVQAKLTTDFSEVIIDPTGAIFRLRSGVYATQGNTVDNLGVPKRIGCGTGIQPLTILKKKALELALADDTLNEFLYALWFGGLLEFPVGKELLGDIDLSTYGISNLKLKVRALLAPTASDCNDDSELLAHIGDMRIDATLDIFGQKMTVVVHATFVAGIDVAVEGNQLNIKLTKIKSVKTDVEVVEDNLIASEGVVESLIADKLIGNLLDILGGSALGGFELPVIDLSSTVKGLPPGTGIAIDPQTVERKDGNTIIGGKLK